MKNKLTDLNDHLFSQLERLADEELTDEQLAKEVKRADAMVDVAGTVLKTGELALRAAELRAEYHKGGELELPTLLEAPKS